MPTTCECPPKIGYLSAMRGPAKLELRQFVVEICQSLLENELVTRVAAGFNLVQDSGA